MPIDPSNPTDSHLPTGASDLAGDSLEGGQSGPDGDATPDIQRLRQAWREGVEGGGYQTAETVFAELGARYATPHRGA